jgi:lipopolysaccharide transport protein LptA
MKTIRLLLTLLLAAPVLAEDKPSPIAAVAGTNSLGALKSPIEITSRSSEVNLRSNVVVYVGNVRVTEANMSLTSEFLVAAMPQRGGRIERIQAETNVVINMTDEQGQKIKGGGQRLLYTYRVVDSQTNEVVELSGDPIIETPQGSTRADVITYDRLTGQVRFKNPRMHIEAEGGLTNLLSPSNLQPARTNKTERKP